VGVPARPEESENAAQPPPATTASALTLIGKHQVSALFATVVDFAVMILVVEALHRSPVMGTALGATSGAIANFTLGRHWTFRARNGRAWAQALRYAVVSFDSLVLNAIGVFALVAVPHVHYVAARVCTALAVSLLWNFPMHRHFVFPTASR